MKLKKIMFAAVCAFSFGMSASATAGPGWRTCCQMMQGECLLNGGTPEYCAQVYSNCTISRRCIIQ